MYTCVGLCIYASSYLFVQQLFLILSWLENHPYRNDNGQWDNYLTMRGNME